MGNDESHEMYTIPVNIMLKDNADDIKDKVLNAHKGKHPVMEQIIKEAFGITTKYTGLTVVDIKKISYPDLKEIADAVFIALHGRPGEDGAIQEQLEKYKIPYNGSGIESSRITINKFETNEILRKNGITVANHSLFYKKDWQKNKTEVLDFVEQSFKYPIIAKPADDGCSSAVKKIKSRSEMEAFANLMFRDQQEWITADADVLKLKKNEDFPQKNFFLIEDLVSKEGAKHFLEVTGGLLTKRNPDGSINYEMFEPSETLATGEVLSLEEKFLAGEGQNITPARYTKKLEDHKVISKQVRETLKKVAEILNIEGYARIDAFVRIFDHNKAETIIIEVNSLPGMTPATCIFHQTALNGYKPYDFIDSILTYGIQKNKEKILK